MAELERKLETLERHYAYGEIERDIYSKFSQELKEEMRGIQANMEKLSDPLSNQGKLSDKGLSLLSS